MPRPGVARQVPSPIMRGLPNAELQARRDPSAGILSRVFEKVRKFPKRVVFAEGEEEQVIRAAIAYANQGLGTAILVGRENRIHETAEGAGHRSKPDRDGIEVHNAALSHRNSRLRAVPVRSGYNARATCSGTVSGSSTRTAITSPPPWWRSATRTPW